MAQAWRATAGLSAYRGAFRYGAMPGTGITPGGLPSMLPSQGPTPPRWYVESATLGSETIDLSQERDHAFGYDATQATNSHTSTSHDTRTSLGLHTTETSPRVSLRTVFRLI